MRLLAQHGGIVAQGLSPVDVVGEGSSAGVFASAGSRSLGVTMRVALTRRLIVSLAAVETNTRYSANGFGSVRIDDAITFGGSLRYITGPAKVRGFVEGNTPAKDAAAVPTALWRAGGRPASQH